MRAVRSHPDRSAVRESLCSKKQRTHGMKALWPASHLHFLASVVPPPRRVVFSPRSPQAVSFSFLLPPANESLLILFAIEPPHPRSASAVLPRFVTPQLFHVPDALALLGHAAALVALVSRVCRVAPLDADGAELRVVDGAAASAAAVVVVEAAAAVVVVVEAAAAAAAAVVVVVVEAVVVVVILLLHPHPPRQNPLLHSKTHHYHLDP